MNAGSEQWTVRLGGDVWSPFPPSCLFPCPCLSCFLPLHFLWTCLLDLSSIPIHPPLVYKKAVLPLFFSHYWFVFPKSIPFPICVLLFFENKQPHNILPIQFITFFCFLIWISPMLRMKQVLSSSFLNPFNGK